MEELVAEIGSAFLCADLEITPEPREDHAAYIESWLKALKNDKRAFFTAASHAQRATDYLRGFQSSASIMQYDFATRKALIDGSPKNVAQTNVCATRRDSCDTVFYALHLAKESANCCCKSTLTLHTPLNKVAKGCNKCYLLLKGDLVMSQTRGVKLDDTTQQRLAALARIRDRSPHWLMCRAIETFLEREENYEREKREDMERWERYQLTGEAIPHEQATAWLENLSKGKVMSCPK